ncbi:MAG: cohesin domain-containing protein [Nanoarchaeota archaeon]
MAKNNEKNIVKNILFVILFVLLVGFVQAVNLSFSPSSQQVGTGVDFDVNVTVSNVTDLYSFQFDLTYNSSVLQYIGISSGPFLNSDGSTLFELPPNTGTPGLLDNYAVTRIAVLYGVSGSGVIAKIRFRGLSAGTSNLVISNDSLYDSNNTNPQPILHNALTGDVIVIQSAVCGNNVVEGTEQCDGTNLSSQTCISQGYTGGTLSCTFSCTFNVTACTSGPGCIDLDGDGYNATTGGACGVIADCNDGNPAVHPGALENIASGITCADGLDNDCSGEKDWDSQNWAGGNPLGGSSGMHGDLSCPVGFIDLFGAGTIEITSSQPYYENTAVIVNCYTTVSEAVNSVRAYVIDGTKNYCNFESASGIGSQTFNCSTGSQGTKVFGCEIDQSKSYNSTPDATLMADIIQYSPLNCIVNSLDWSVNNVSEGTTVTLNVNGTNCDGLPVSFSVWEYDGFPSELIGGLDDPVNVTPLPSTFVSGTATATWTAEWQDDGLLNLGGDPEYYFMVNVNGTNYDSGKSLGQLLSVSLSQPRYETINIPLQTGKNPFSLPLIPNNLSVTSVFNSTLQAQADKIYTYNGSFAVYYFDGIRPSNLDTLEIGRGYILFMNQPGVLSINGTKRDSNLNRPVIQLTSGWNLIGTFSNVYDAKTILGNQNVNYSTIYAYDTLTQQFIPITDTDSLYGEKSYWVYVEQPSSFVPLTGFILQNG